ncbi:MAG: glycosyltransferase family 4 protein [Candidatus Hermodarchaeota archaeon]
MKSNNKPKVGIFTKPIDQRTSGSGSHLRQLVNHMLEINDKFNIILIHHSKNSDRIYNKTNELIISMNPIIATVKLLKENFDILHFSPLTILSPIWLKKPKKVATIHGGGALFLPDQFNKFKILHSQIIRPFYARKLDYIFTVSKTTRNLIITHHRVNEDRIRLTYNAVDNDFKVLKDEPIEIKDKYGIDSPFLFHLSKYSPRKNPWTILNSFKKVKENKKNLKLVIAGNGWKNQEVLEFIKKNEIKDDIIFTGFTPRKDIIEFLNLAEIFIFPSLFEGFGIPNLEAMACGCPVITSNAFAIPEIVGDAALILNNSMDPIELSNKIIQVLEDTNLKMKLIEKGLERVKLYSWKESAREVLSTYEKCLELH